MNIKIKMHSELDCPLKPDLKLIQQAVKDMVNSDRFDNQRLETICWNAGMLRGMHDELESLKAGIKNAVLPKAKQALIERKNALIDEFDKKLEWTLAYIVDCGGGSYYHYKFDMHFNRIVAGLMGSTCYMKETFDELQNKGIDNILAIAKTVEQNGHHSCFGHAHLTLELSGIPKALAMVLNNESEYNTSEKSARYTVMTDIDQEENALFEKWKSILSKEIDEKYGQCQPFFDAKGVKVGKLAQENARYMISVFTPSNMVYTTSLRQLNYLAKWFEDVIADENANVFYQGIKNEMQEFVDFVKNNNLYSEALTDSKDRKLSLFGTGILKEVISNPVYAFKYNASFACLAQLQRHRTINYNINEAVFMDNFLNNIDCYIPPILKSDSRLTSAWRIDMLKVKTHLPQGMLIPIIENGQIEDFRLKAMERNCSCAQKEIRDLTKAYSGRISGSLFQDLMEVDLNLKKHPGNSDLLSIQENTQALYDQFSILKQRARCNAGYDCKSPCGFKDGIRLESEV